VNFPRWDREEIIIGKDHRRLVLKLNGQFTFQHNEQLIGIRVRVPSEGQILKHGQAQTMTVDLANGNIPVTLGDRMAQTTQVFR
jgi:hypothetical protein